MKVKHNEQISQAITTGQGIRQGDSLSPILFNLVMKHILNNLSNKKGYYFGSYNINSICYADDTVLIAENEDDLQRLLFQFYKTCQSFNMRISTQKTKCITISKEPLRCKLAINEYLIEQVMEIQYLGVTITSDGRSIKEAKEQSIKANRIAGCLNHSIWQNQYLRKDTKVRIYKAVIRPVLSYAAETRADSKKICQMMEVSEMRVLRKITNKTLRDKEPNINIRQTCQIDIISDWVRERRKKWNDHIDRMEEDRLVKVTRDRRPEGRRRVGRPRTRWKDIL